MHMIMIAFIIRCTFVIGGSSCGYLFLFREFRDVGCLLVLLAEKTVFPNIIIM